MKIIPSTFFFLTTIFLITELAQSEKRNYRGILRDEVELGGKVEDLRRVWKRGSHHPGMNTLMFGKRSLESNSKNGDEKVYNGNRRKNNGFNNNWYKMNKQEDMVALNPMVIREHVGRFGDNNEIKNEEKLYSEAYNGAVDSEKNFPSFVKESQRPEKRLAKENSYYDNYDKNSFVYSSSNVGKN